MLRTIDKFGGRTVVVIGDLITDEYLFGKPGRISREAPVIILRFSEREVLRGAANARQRQRARRQGHPHRSDRAGRRRRADGALRRPNPDRGISRSRTEG